MGTAQFDTPGAQVWTAPAGVTAIVVECWGPGGDGADGIHIASPVDAWIAGGGGGGGAYAQKTLTVVPGNNYNLVVGAHGSTTPSSFESSCIADYGRNGQQGSEDGGGNITLGPAGAGGQLAACVGDTTTAGFSGGTGSFGPGGYGGLSPFGGQPGIGGVTFPDNPSIDGTAAEAPGSGGGAGGSDGLSVVGNGADGGNGRVLISWETTNPVGIGSQEAFGTPTIQQPGIPSFLPGATWTKLLMSTAGVYVMYPLGGFMWGWWLPAMVTRVMNHGNWRLITGLDHTTFVPEHTWTKYAMTTAGVDVMYPESGPQVGGLGVHSAFMIGDSEQSEADGIASAEAFGRPFISAVGSTSPTGIASEEAFGTPEVTPFIVVRPTGIVSGEAFGTLEMEPGNVDVSPTSIASAEVFGLPSLHVSIKPRVLIGGRDRTAYIHSESNYSWNLLRGSRGTCYVPLMILPGDPTAPQIGELIEIFDPVTDRVWAGTVERISLRWIGNLGHHIHIITGVTLESLFDTAEVDKMQFEGSPPTTSGDAFETLYDASGVTQVTLGTVDAGEDVVGLEVTRIADGFASLALRSNKIWFVDPRDLTLNFKSALSEAAPWVFTEKELLWETVEWSQSRADFRDTQVIQSPDGTTQTILAVTPNTSIGRRSVRLTMTTSYTSAGALQEALAVLRRFSTLPSQVTVQTDRAGITLGMLLEFSILKPLEAGALLDGFWQVQEVEARMITGMDRHEPEDSDGFHIGHFRYTLRLVNSLSTAIFQGDGVTTVFTLSTTPGDIAYIRVSPNPELYTTSAGPGPDEVTIEPAMPPGTYGAVGFQGDATPDTGTWLDPWKAMVPVSASAGPAQSSGGAGAQVFLANLLLRRLLIGDDITDHAPVYHAGTGTRVLAVLRLLLTADLVVRINLNGNELLTVTIDSGTAVDDVLEFPMSARAFTVTIASPGVVTVAGATLADDDAVVLHSTGSLPTGLLEDTTYYVVNGPGATFSLAATPGGTAIDTSGTQSGNHWLTSDAIPSPTLADKDVLTADILSSDDTQSDRDGIASLTVEWA